MTKFLDLNFQSLHLGCGEKYMNYWANIDIRKDSEADFIYNLNKIPYTFISKNHKIKYILAEHLLEHLDDWESQLKEWHRILDDDGEIEIAVPHHSCNNLNPYHKHNIGHKGLIDYFNKYNPDKQFEVTGIYYCWFTTNKYFSTIIDIWLNLFPHWFIDRFLCRLVLGIEEIRFFIKKKKVDNNQSK